MSLCQLSSCLQLCLGYLPASKPKHNIPTVIFMTFCLGQPGTVIGGILFCSQQGHSLGVSFFIITICAKPSTVSIA